MPRRSANQNHGIRRRERTVSEPITTSPYWHQEGRLGLETAREEVAVTEFKHFCGVKLKIDAYLLWSLCVFMFTFCRNVASTVLRICIIIQNFKNHNIVFYSTDFKIAAY
jgi:hypothetical protein